MAEIRIRLVGDVVCRNRMKMSAGFLYDVPVDPLGIPCIPLSELLPEEIIGHVLVGFAFPEGYPGMAREAYRIVKRMPDARSQIRACFTGKRFYPEEGAWVRFLRAGLVFRASVYGQDGLDGLRAALASVTRLGVEMEGISGRAECSLFEAAQGRLSRTLSGRDLPCDRLKYVLMPLTPMCIHMPYADGARTATCVPGPVLREALEQNAGERLAAGLRRMTFSNAYISDGKERLLPLPLCMSLVKLDKSKLHYRLSPGKDPKRVEQDVSPGDAYARDYESFLTTFTRPETERIISRDGTVYDALCRGQMFSGMIYGEDADLRELYASLLARPELALGHLKREGFGQVYLTAELIPADSLREERLERSFDVCCLSPTLIIGRTGMPDTTAEGILGEIERLLQIPGRLRIADRYMEAQEDFGWNSAWGQDGPVTRCVAKGSVLRLETRDGQPVNIAPVLHAFIGERTRDGYGEMMAYPARDGYYRAAEAVPPEKYGLKLPLSLLSLHYAADLTNEVIQRILKKRIQSLALSDRRDIPAGADVEKLVPLDLLRMISAQLNPAVTDGELASWYRQGLGEDDDEFVFDA